MTIGPDKDLCLSVEVMMMIMMMRTMVLQLKCLGLATYSNSESTVSSYDSIFEILWIQAE